MRTSTPKLDVIVVDADLRQSLVCVRELGRAGVRVGAFDTNARTPASRSRWCSASGVLPSLVDDPDGWVAAVIRCASDHRAGVIICSHDGGVHALRDRREDVEQYARLALASESAMEIAVNKESTLVRAVELDIPIPRGISAASTDEVGRAVAEIGLPLVVKPAESWNELVDERSRLGASIATSREETLAAAEAVWRAGGTPILQEWLTGAREAVSVFRADGHVWAAFAQVAHRANPPLGGSSVVRESIPLRADIWDAADRLTAAIELDGYSEIEFRRDSRGRAVLMEINPRLSASVEIAVRSGIDFPGLLFNWCADRPLRKFGPYRTGVRMRWVGGDIHWLGATLRQQGRPDILSRRRALGAFLSDFARPTAYDYLDRDDPRPALSASATMCTRWLRRHAYRGAAGVLRVMRRAGLDVRRP